MAFDLQHVPRETFQNKTLQRLLCLKNYQQIRYMKSSLWPSLVKMFFVSISQLNDKFKRIILVSIPGLYLIYFHLFTQLTTKTGCSWTTAAAFAPLVEICFSNQVTGNVNLLSTLLKDEKIKRDRILLNFTNIPGPGVTKVWDLFSTSH